MKKLLVLILVLSIFTPVKAQGGPVYLMIGASNAANGYAAQSFTEQTGVPVLLCAKGKTGLRHWMRGTSLFSSCMKQASSYQVIGLLFVNGEYEANTGLSWSYYFPLVVSAIRAKVGDVPVAFVEVHPQMPGRYVVKTRSQQIVSGGCMVVPDDLYLPADNWHYLQPELSIIGVRLADCFR